MKFRRAMFVLMCAALLPWFPSFVAAAGGARRLDDPGIDMWSTGSRALVNQAIQLPAVKAAVSNFEAQGYLRVPTYDAGRSVDDTTLVLIAFQQPGVSMNVSMPLIAVVSTPGAFGPTIDVRGGIVERAPGGKLQAGTGFNAHALRVTGGGDLSTPGSAVKLQTDPGTDAQWYQWIYCTFYYCEECSGIPMPVIAQMICCFAAAIACHKIYVY